VFLNARVPARGADYETHLGEDQMALVDSHGCETCAVRNLNCCDKPYLVPSDDL
jgi:hypothetical protein